MHRFRERLISLPGKSANTDGLTLLECVVAIAVIGITTAVIAPVMVFSIATRVQNQKAEQALQVAQGEVEKIRLLVERGGDYSTELASYPVTTAASVAGTGAPNTLQASLNSTTTNTAKGINIDDDADDEFAVQVFRSAGTPASSPVPIAFDLGVRVYDRDALQNNSGSLQTDPAGLNFTSGEGERGTRPLAVIYTKIFRGDQEGALCQYRQYIDSTASTAGMDCS
ncbi:MAG: prepilin-type N-terminal cleavage/methylation domain-containing protein [Phormidesmis sp.]